MNVWRGNANKLQHAGMHAIYSYYGMIYKRIDRFTNIFKFMDDFPSRPSNDYSINL